jgi:hypothetical protein
MTNSAASPSPDRVRINEKLGNELTLLAGQLDAGSYRMIKLIAEFDEREAWGDGGGVKSCAHWLNWKCGIAMGAAREKVRVAHCLENLPLIDASFAIGEISYSKVRAMTRVATPETEDALLVFARHGTASHVEQLVSKYKRVKRNMEDESEQEREKSRTLTYYHDNDGMWVINARLSPEAGSLLVKAIEALVAPIREEKRAQLLEQRLREQEQENKEENVPAETFSEAIEQDDPNHFYELLQHTRADALVTLAEHFLATCGEKAQFRGLKGSERCQVMLHVDINTLRQRSSEDCGGERHCHLDEKPWVSAETARRLSCDASLVTVLEDENGKVLNIGRRARTVPASLRRTLDIRDKTCRFPGCCEAGHVEYHHIEHWADGGETSLDNIAKICKFHHAQLHRGCFDVRVEAPLDDQSETQLVFTTPSGRRIETDLSPQFPPQVAQTAKEALQHAAPEVDATTCVTRWQGEPCDYSMAIEGLLRRDGNLVAHRELDSHLVGSDSPHDFLHI